MFHPLGRALAQIDDPASLGAQAVDSFGLGLRLLGWAIAACAMVPVLNLFAAVLGVAAMVHVLHGEVVHNI